MITRAERTSLRAEKTLANPILRVCFRVQLHGGAPCSKVDESISPSNAVLANDCQVQGEHALTLHMLLTKYMKGKFPLETIATIYYLDAQRS
jgi:hypothetical protein